MPKSGRQSDSRGQLGILHCEAAFLSWESRRIIAGYSGLNPLLYHWWGRTDGAISGPARGMDQAETADTCRFYLKQPVVANP
jgi:hypothetical protein